VAQVQVQVLGMEIALGSRVVVDQEACTYWIGHWGLMEGSPGCCLVSGHRYTYINVSKDCRGRGVEAYLSSSVIPLSSAVRLSTMRSSAT
jgi:hypothetical protein